MKQTSLIFACWCLGASVAFGHPKPKEPSRADEILGDWDIIERYDVPIEKNRVGLDQFRFTKCGDFYRTAQGRWFRNGSYQIDGDKLIFKSKRSTENGDEDYVEVFTIKKLTTGSLIITNDDIGDRCILEKRKK